MKQDESGAEPDGEKGAEEANDVDALLAQEESVTHEFEEDEVDRLLHEDVANDAGTGMARSSTMRRIVPTKTDDIPRSQSPRHPSSCPWICLLCPAGAPSHSMVCFQMPQMSQSRRNAPKRCLRERLCSHISRVIKSARALSKERQVCGRTRLWRLWPLRLRLSHRRRHAPAPALALTVALVLPLSLALALTPLPA